MPEKRKRSVHDATDEDGKNRKKQKQGFKVGPDNLPDGTHRRKTQKIKSSLIQTAKIKKNYAKLKRQANIPHQQDEGIPKPATTDPAYEGPEPTTSPHPDRQALMNKSPEPDAATQKELPKDRQAGNRGRTRKPKHQPFAKEYSQAQQRKAEAEERRKQREEADRQRQQKVEERERFRKAMAKARTGGQNGQRKLGRESGVLLERVRRLVGEGG